MSIDALEGMQNNMLASGCKDILPRFILIFVIVVDAAAGVVESDVSEGVDP